MEYSCSPGGVDCWELEIDEGCIRGFGGHSSNYSDFNTAGEALDYLIRMYPDVRHEVDILSLSAYNGSMD